MIVFFNAVSAIAALLSAYFWVRAASAEVPPPPEWKGGFGAVLGGPVIAKNSKGKPIELIGSMQSQAKWNSQAAYAAAVSAFFLAAGQIASWFATTAS